MKTAALSNLLLLPFPFSLRKAHKELEVYEAEI